jgi:hypothetical protein
MFWLGALSIVFFSLISCKQSLLNDNGVSQLESEVVTEAIKPIEAPEVPKNRPDNTALKSPCPGAFTLIGSVESKGAFCISKEREKSFSTLSGAKKICQKKSFGDRKAYLCSGDEWRTACFLSRDSLGMTDGKFEWVNDLNHNVNYVNLGAGSTCSALGKVKTERSNAYRCCFR